MNQEPCEGKKVETTPLREGDSISWICILSTVYLCVSIFTEGKNRDKLLMQQLVNFDIIGKHVLDIRYF